MRLELIPYSVLDAVPLYFNSIKVRLEPPKLWKHRAVHQFQFHKGAIRTKPRFVTLLSVSNFNSIKVRLEQCWRWKTCPNHANFNSIKVRLELDTDPIIVDAHIFQFHKGAIRTTSSALVTVYLADFNSIKVRLELAFTQKHIDPFTTFQFHKGAIRTLATLSLSNCTHISIP